MTVVKKRQSGFVHILLTVIILAILTGTILLIGVKIKNSQQTKSKATDIVLPVTEKINKKVYLLVFDPVLANGKKLTEEKGYRNYNGLNTEAINFFKRATNNRVNYSIAITREINDREVKDTTGNVISNLWKKWLPKSDEAHSFYTEQRILDVLNKKAPPLSPDIMDYNVILNSADLDICGKLNRGEIDELWMYGGPYFGFYEAAQAAPVSGKTGFSTNGPVFTSNSCQKILPIMGFSYEREYETMIEDFGHRTEGTMRFANAKEWGKYVLNRAETPGQPVYGCGWMHYSPNTNVIADAYLHNLKDNVKTNCEDYANYPNLNNPVAVAKEINCTEWGCTTAGYFEWWFKYLPHFTGVDSQNKFNDWLLYAFDPNKAFYEPISNSSREVTDPINKKVYVIVFDPVLASGERLSSYAKWRPYMDMVNESIDFFKKATRGRVNYTVAEVKQINDKEEKDTNGNVTNNIWKKWLKKNNASNDWYTEKQYLDLVNKRGIPLSPDIINYYQLLGTADNNPKYAAAKELDICGKLNRGEIDEVWLFGGPWFGFYESAMATSSNGPVGFWVNGPTFNQTSCQKLLPIGLPGGHTFGHRIESTLSHVYSSIEGWTGDTKTPFNRFSLNRGQHSRYNPTGCGNIHFPPNALGPDPVHEYIYWEKESVSTACDDFYNYPNLADPQNLASVAKTVSCTEWGCNEYGYDLWWYQHLPHYKGLDQFGKLNDWLLYAFDPNKAFYGQVNGSPTVTPTPSPSLTPATFSYESVGATTNDHLARFFFKYTGVDSNRNFTVNISTSSDLFRDVYAGFASGPMSGVGLAVDSPQNKWDKYQCGKTLYWQVVSQLGNQSPIQSSIISCIIPTPRISLTSRITIWAAGTPAMGVYPTIKLTVDDKPIRSWTNVTGPWNNYQRYEFVLPGTVQLSQVKVWFINDLATANEDRNVVIQKVRITYDDFSYQEMYADDPKVFSIGTWKPDSGCAPGYKQSRWLHCNGYLRF